MKKLVIATYLAVASIAATAAETYVELGYTRLTFKDVYDSGSAVRAKPGMLDAVLGVELNEFLAVEVALGLGLSDASFKEDGQAYDVQVGIDDALGIFLKPKARVNKNLEFFGRVGLVQTNSTLHVEGVPTDVSTSEMAYGLGVNFYIDEATYITASYMKFYDQDNLTVTGPTIGVGFRF